MQLSNWSMTVSCVTNKSPAIGRCDGNAFRASNATSRTVQGEGSKWHSVQRSQVTAQSVVVATQGMKEA